MSGVRLTRAKSEARRLAIYELHLTGATSPRIANSQEFQRRWGVMTERSVREAIDTMNRRNSKWYEDHKLPEKRIGVFYKQQVDRMLHILNEQYILFYGYKTPQSLDWKEGMKNEAGLKLQCSAIIERTIYHLCDILGVKARSIDDQEVDQILNKLLTEIKAYKEKQTELEEIRQKQKVHPL